MRHELSKVETSKVTFFALSHLSQVDTCQTGYPVQNVLGLKIQEKHK